MKQPFNPRQVATGEFTYNLPDHRIALFPLEQRDSSKLLVANVHSAAIEHARFKSLSVYLPEGALLIRNETQVIEARIALRKASGGSAEALLLHPAGDDRIPALALAERGKSIWRCILGGNRIRAGSTLEASFAVDGKRGNLQARVISKEDREATVALEWQPSSFCLAELLQQLGTTPLPPYIRREVQPDDKQRYQTIYARHEGSAAAPTAGLHFTPEVFEDLRRKGVEIESLTLHVGAGTFQPLNGASADEHRMHDEQIIVGRSTLLRVLAQVRRRDEVGAGIAPVIPVGTTSVRSLESLYCMGLRLVAGDQEAWNNPLLHVDQWTAYSSIEESAADFSVEDALLALLRWMDQHGMNECRGTTRLMIIPGYRFALCDALISNFHQPGSTLLMLVAAFLGRDLWRKVYDEALARDYRFLSYGDSSLLLGRELGAVVGRTTMPS